MKKIDKNKIKTWFVTGASSGVGHEMCRQLLERGYNIIAVSRRIPDFEHENALCLSVDVTKPETIDAAIKTGIEKFGKIDVLVNNAGITASILCEDETLEHIKSVMEVNYFGAFNTIKELLPHFRGNKNGTIINNASMHGLSSRSYGTAYCSSKHAIEGLTSVVRHEAKNFCRVMAFELGFYSSTNIVKNSVNIKNTIEEYKNLKTFYKPLNYSNYTNDLNKTIKIIIDTIENLDIPRHLILGRDAVFKAETEIDILKENIKLAKHNAKKCSPIKNSFLQNIFSVKNEYSNNKKRKVITILGLKIKFISNGRKE